MQQGFAELLQSVTANHEKEFDRQFGTFCDRLTDTKKEIADLVHELLRSKEALITKDSDRRVSVKLQHRSSEDEDSEDERPITTSTPSSSKDKTKASGRDSDRSK